MTQISNMKVIGPQALVQVASLVRARNGFARDIAAQRRHGNNYKSHDPIMQPRDWLTQTATLFLLKQVSCDCVGEKVHR